MARSLSVAAALLAVLLTGCEVASSPSEAPALVPMGEYVVGGVLDRVTGAERVLVNGVPLLSTTRLGQRSQR